MVTRWKSDWLKENSVFYGEVLIFVVLVIILHTQFYSATDIYHGYFRYIHIHFTVQLVV